MRYTEAISLNEGWRFALTLAAGVDRPDFDDRAFSPVTLPHDWQIAGRRDPDMEWGWSQGYWPRAQVGWYRRRLAIPEAWAGARLYLVLEGCQRFYEIWVDGQRVGGHRYGYVPYVLDLAPYVTPGREALLCVRVDNAHTLGDRWYSGAGLDRDVYLLVRRGPHLAPFGLAVDAVPEDGAGVCHVRAALRSDAPA